MKKRYWLLLLVITACAPMQEISPKPAPPAPVVEAPVQEPPAPVERRVILNENVNDYIINREIPPFSLVSTDAIYDNFSIIPVERYDARYQAGGITALVHIFKFATRLQLNVVLNSEFYDVINLGATSHQGHNIALFLTQNDHRVAIWPSGTALVYVDTFLEFAAREIVEEYLEKYPSDLEIDRCVDSDGDNRFIKGTTNKVRIGSTTVKWEDVCLRDFAPYLNKQYVSEKGLSEDDGLLEGRCEMDARRPGFIFEYACPRGCDNGKCNLS